MTFHPNMRGIIGLRAETDPLRAAIGDLTGAFGQFRTAHDKRLDALNARLDEIEADAGRIRAGGDFHNQRSILEPMAQFVMSGEITASMQVGSDPDGGYLTSPEQDSVIRQFAENMSPMRRLCRVVPSRSGEFEQLFATGQAASGWVGETGGRTETTNPKLSKLTITAREIYAMPTATQKLIDDASNAEQFILDEIGNEFVRQENAAFVTGSGITDPMGFLSASTPVTTSDATRAFGVVQYVPTGASAGFPAASGIPGASDPGALADLVYAVKAQYRANGMWQMNSATGGAIRKLRDADGRWLWADPLSSGQPPMLLGYGVEFNEDMPDIGANSFSVAFGDWRRFYTIVDRIGMRVLRDPYTNKPFVNFYATQTSWWRCDQFEGGQAVEILGVVKSTGRVLMVDPPTGATASTRQPSRHFNQHGEPT